MSDAGGAAFNPAVRTEDNAPAPEPDDDRAGERDCNDQADSGRPTGEESA